MNSLRTSSNGPPRPGLIAQKKADSLGRVVTHWVRPGEDVLNPRERKVEYAKKERNRIQHVSQKTPEEIAKIKEITARHLEFERLVQEQRKASGGGVHIPKVGDIVRVYATGKVNVGGMLAKIKSIDADGRQVSCELTSGKTYTLPLDHIQIAKSLSRF